MSQLSDLDKMTNFDEDLNNESNNDEEPEDLKGSKKGNQDLNRVLNFYGDMDKPNNERKIENQQIGSGQRDW